MSKNKTTIVPEKAVRKSWENMSGKKVLGKGYSETCFIQKISSRKMVLGKTERGKGKTTQPSAVVNRHGVVVRVYTMCGDATDMV